MTVVTDNPGKSRYELKIDGAEAFVDYSRQGRTLVLIHTEVPRALSGQGVGTRLARGVLDEARREGWKVIARCEFIAGFISRNPDYQDLLASG